MEVKVEVLQVWSDQRSSELTSLVGVKEDNT